MRLRALTCVLDFPINIARTCAYLVLVALDLLQQLKFPRELEVDRDDPRPCRRVGVDETARPTAESGVCRPTAAAASIAVASIAVARSRVAGCRPIRVPDCHLGRVRQYTIRI